MENHVFSPLYVAKLPINAIYSLSKSTIELAKPVVSEIGPIPTAALTYLETINQNLVASMNKNQKSTFTDDVTALDKDRDTDIAEIKRVLGIDSLFVSLETKNKAFDTKFKSRNTEYSERTEAASDVKPAAVAAYLHFCTAIEQAANFAPNDTIIALFNKMDELRKNYHANEGGGKDTPTADNAPAK